MMKNLLMVMVVVGVAGFAGAAFVEDFDTFSTGPLVAQESWEANGGFDVVADGFSGNALKSNSYTDKTTRHDGTGVDFDLTKNNANGYEFGFDIRSTATSAINTRMYLRRGTMARYSPSAGFLTGKLILRPLGEGGANVYGNDLASSAFYGEGTAEDPGYWVKGDWLRVKTFLTGTDNEMVTVRVFNLSRGNLEIPTGLTDVDMTSTAAFIDGYWTRFNFRNGTADVSIDNAYVTEIPEPATLAILGLGGLLLRRKKM